MSTNDVKIYIKRDNKDNFAQTSFVPRCNELVAMYHNHDVTYKLGDGKTCIKDLPEVKNIKDISSFTVYTKKGNALIDLRPPISIDNEEE